MTEQERVGMALVSGAAAAVIVARVPAAGLQDPRHRVILRSVERLVASGTCADTITVIRDLEQRGRLDDAGGKDYVHECAAVAPAR